MAMTPKEKKIFRGATAGVVCLLLLLFGVKKCNNSKDAAAELDGIRAEKLAEAQRADQAEKDLARALALVDSLQLVNRDLCDSLGIVNKDLIDCRSGQRCIVNKTTTKKKTQTSTTRTTSKPRSSVTRSSACTTARAGTSTSTVTLGNDARDNVITVNTGTIVCAQPADTTKRCAAVSEQTVIIRRAARLHQSRQR